MFAKNQLSSGTVNWFSQQFRHATNLNIVGAGQSNDRNVPETHETNEIKRFRRNNKLERGILLLFTRSNSRIDEPKPFWT